MVISELNFCSKNFAREKEIVKILFQLENEFILQNTCTEYVFSN